MSQSYEDLRTKAARLRAREIGEIHAKAIAKKLNKECLVLTDKEMVVVRDHIASLLMEVFTGATTLEPNHFQTGAAMVGKEEVTEADMLMFTAKMDWAQKFCGRMLFCQEAKEVAMHVITGSPMPVIEKVLEVPALEK